ncbi:MAG: HAMP domain-containing histidine kinase [Oscillospiraceae bacterium]|nr:HAMP domain-containing histidine kinase [Oscillospiraceae bacterium]
MIKKLRIKFICIMMAIAMVMVGFILGVVVYFTSANMEMQSVSMMRAIASAPFQKGALMPPEGDEVRLPFFTVQVSNRGELVTAGGGYFDLSDREYLQQLVNLTMEAQGDSGVLAEYDLRYLKAMSPRGMSIVFADTATEDATIQSLIYSCVIIFLAAMLVFFGISVLLSRWAIKPVAHAWDQQRQFVADASHELKTPLAVIMTNAELMQNENTDETESKKFSQNILSMTYQMRSLVENMLEMARVDNGTVKMHFDRLDMSQVIEDATLSFQLLYEEKETPLECHIREGISVHGSEQHIYQLMDVLLDNALKYGTPKEAVRVVLTGSGRSCLLSVASAGDPFTKEEQKNIFKRFYRADKARAMNGSYGLGLSIAEAIAEAHKGKIWVESKDGYNTFYVQLPMLN